MAPCFNCDGGRNNHSNILSDSLCSDGVLIRWQWSSYRAFRGPLSHIPGPTVSKWTNLRLQFAVLTGERVRYVHALHEAYGLHQLIAKLLFQH